MHGLVLGNRKCPINPQGVANALFREFAILPHTEFPKNEFYHLPLLLINWGAIRAPRDFFVKGFMNYVDFRRCNGHAPLPADSPYFTTSECKAKFLTQYVKDMKTSPSPKSQDSQELNQQKVSLLTCLLILLDWIQLTFQSLQEMLVSRISRKLEILKAEQLEIREEIGSNELLGQQVVERVRQSAKRNEFDKFKLHVEEIEKITSLLLGLSGRLARAENALMSLADNANPQEKVIS